MLFGPLRNVVTLSEGDPGVPSRFGGDHGTTGWPRLTAGPVRAADRFQSRRSSTARSMASERDATHSLW
jgi:hypothetical protein